jgi:hypothetical protein
MKTKCKGGIEEYAYSLGIKKGKNQIDFNKQMKYVIKLMDTAREQGYKKGLMKQGVFTTSMNRKVCYEAGYKKAKEDILKLIDGNRKEMLYVLSYSLTKQLTAKEIEYFNKMFITLYEDKLKQKIKELK